MRTSRTCRALPEVSPLRHSAPRERLQKYASPEASVRSSASRLAQATIRTIPVAASCAITGTSPAASKRTAPIRVEGAGELAASDIPRSLTGTAPRCKYSLRSVAHDHGHNPQFLKTAAAAPRRRRSGAGRSVRGWLADRHAARAQVGVGFLNRVLAKMEDRGRQHRVGVTLGDALVEVLERAHPARGDHGDRDAVGHGAGEGEVEAVARTVAVHAGEEDLA